MELVFRNVYSVTAKCHRETDSLKHVNQIAAISLEEAMDLFKIEEPANSYEFIEVVNTNRYVYFMGYEYVRQLSAGIREWSDKAFGVGRNGLSMAYHLKKEVDEVIQDIETFVDPGKELADCLMLVLDCASHSGISVRDLLKLTDEKLEINKNRKWGTPDENGVVEHIEEPE